MPLPRKEHENLNGEFFVCNFQAQAIEELNKNWATLNKREEERDKWVKEYIDRTMPIKSHFWILVGSLSVLGTFAAAMEYIQRIGP